MAKAKYKWVLTYTSIEGEKISEIIFIKWILRTRTMEILKTADTLTIEKIKLW